MPGQWTNRASGGIGFNAVGYVPMGDANLGYTYSSNGGDYWNSYRGPKGAHKVGNLYYIFTTRYNRRNVPPNDMYHTVSPCLAVYNPLTETFTNKPSTNIGFNLDYSAYTISYKTDANNYIYFILEVNGYYAWIYWTGSSWSSESEGSSLPAGLLDINNTAPIINGKEWEGFVDMKPIGTYGLSVSTYWKFWIRQKP